MVKTYNVPYYNFTSKNLRNKLDSIVTVTTYTKVLYYLNRGPGGVLISPNAMASFSL